MPGYRAAVALRREPSVEQEATHRRPVRMRRRNFTALMGGAALSAPFVARAQQNPMPAIGFLHFGSPGPFAYQAAAFRQGLGDIGYIEGRNVTIEYRWAEGNYDRLPAFAADLTARKVNVIAAFAPLSAKAAKNATTTIPIVFATGDAIVEGLVANLARPGGNLTGFSLLAGALNPKRLELLSELVPQAKAIALLVNPNRPDSQTAIRDVEAAAHAEGVRIAVLKAGTVEEIDAAFTDLVQLRPGALLVGNDPFYTSRSEQFAALAARYAIPAMYPWREFAAAGGLISYGASNTFFCRQVGVYTGRILKGEKPGDLPVQQPETFEMVINLRTAKALGLTVPAALLARADELIE